MDQNIKELLRNEIVSDFESLKSLTVGSKERASAVEDLVKLYRLTIEESKNDRDFKLKKAEHKELTIRQEREYNLKVRQFELDEMVKTKGSESEDKNSREQTIDRYVKWGIAIAEIILPLTFYACWMRRGFKFEETGTYTSTTFRGLFSHFRPTKR